MDLNETLALLKERAERIDGLTVTTSPAAEVVPPMLVIDDGEVNYNEAMARGGCLLSITLTLYTSAADSESGLFESREYLSPHGDRSVRAALETPLSADDALSSRVTVMEGDRSASGGQVTAVFTGRVHLSGPTV